MSYEITRGSNGCTISIRLVCARTLTIVRMRKTGEYEGQDTIDISITKPEFSSTVNPYKLVEEAFKALVDALDQADEGLSGPGGW